MYLAACTPGREQIRIDGGGDCHYWTGVVKSLVELHGLLSSIGGDVLMTNQSSWPNLYSGSPHRRWSLGIFGHEISEAP